ncbi:MULTISPECIES: hypothetical protein [unclassified Luteimonas]|uniref:hypothetical protein n=1 Tax=unclassified Luteimonas TaxID=2629088 RepID=UPI001604A0D1|nr:MULTISPECIES: hypothetical protein [unclassified Luteimonas]MBB1473233.1 hypothetical protein [Luteimonas sp. MC1782]MBB6598063.1 hypothetical protein [Luteimonas sp. MC1825]QOC88299.1 hypothetical protein IDM46_00515 [Luteimonas sp. MC1825]
MDNGLNAETGDLDTVIALSVEAWKFIRLFQRAVGKLEISEQSRFISQARFFQKRVDALLEQNNVRLESLEGQIFEPGLAATPLNADEFPESNDRLVVAQMIEPVVIGPNGVIRTGTFLLGVV